MIDDLAEDMEGRHVYVVPSSCMLVSGVYYYVALWLLALLRTLLLPGVTYCPLSYLLFFVVIVTTRANAIVLAQKKEEES